MWGVGKGGIKDDYWGFWLKRLWIVLFLVEMGKVEGRIRFGFIFFCFRGRRS